MTNNTPTPIPATAHIAARPAFFAALAALLENHEHSPETIECTCGYRRDA